jgi:hypothetical protein
MRYQSLRRCLYLAVAAPLLVPAAGGAAIVPDAPDTRAGARPALPGLAAIDRPGDHDWYSVRGSDLDGTTFGSLQVRVVSRGLGCIAPRPLFVILRNPEGRWIRTYSVSTEDVSFALPRLPDRYYLEIRAADSTCFALLYAFTTPVLPSPGRVELNHPALLCRIAHNDRVRVKLRIRRLERRLRALKSRAARRRYARYVRAQRSVLKRARAKERRRCDKVR